jgi:hypothetical protein
MTLDEAREHIGHGVVYTAPHGAREDGVITGVSSRVVFVRYADDQTSKGTYAADLTLLAGTAATTAGGVGNG